MEKIYFKTFGCSMAVGETEVMKGLLDKAEYKIIDDPEDADVLIVSICVVKGPSQKHALKTIKEYSEKYILKKIIVAGCISKDAYKEIREITEDASMISTHNLSQIVSVVEETLNDNVIEVLARTKEKKINLPRIRKNPLIGIIPICSGCNNECAYCSVKEIKGSTFSYIPELIVAEVKNCLKDSCREIWLTGQDTGCYGTDIQRTLPELLKKIIEVPGDFKIRLGMCNPQHFIKHFEELIGVYESDKMFKFVHIPVQSGNNGILKQMKRGYKAEDFKELVGKIRKRFPAMTIATDIICGFPTETDEQYNDSVNLIKEVKPDVLNISKFWPRANTKAAEMPQLNGGVIKDRSRFLATIFEFIAYKKNREWAGWEGNIFIDEKGTTEDTWLGRNFSYKQVVVESSSNLFGRVVPVKITHATKNDLRGVTTKI